MNNAASSASADKTGRLPFVNKRAEVAWKFREALDPASDAGIAIPRDPELKADLCALRWKLTVRGVQIESKDDVKERIGRSPDKGDALLLASIVTPKEVWGPMTRQQSKRHIV